MPEYAIVDKDTGEILQVGFMDDEAFQSHPEHANQKKVVIQKADLEQLASSANVDYESGEWKLRFDKTDSKIKTKDKYKADKDKVL
jgi:hypothetical protein